MPCKHQSCAASSVPFSETTHSAPLLAFAWHQRPGGTRNHRRLRKVCAGRGAPHEDAILELLLGVRDITAFRLPLPYASQPPSCFQGMCTAYEVTDSPTISNPVHLHTNKPLRPRAVRPARRDPASAYLLQRDGTKIASLLLNYLIGFTKTHFRNLCSWRHFFPSKASSEDELVRPGSTSTLGKDSVGVTCLPFLTSSLSSRA